MESALGQKRLDNRQPDEVTAAEVFLHHTWSIHPLIPATTLGTTRRPASKTTTSRKRKRTPAGTEPGDTTTRSSLENHHRRPYFGNLQEWEIQAAGALSRTSTRSTALSPALPPLDCPPPSARHFLGTKSSSPQQRHNITTTRGHHRGPKMGEKRTGRKVVASRSAPTAAPGGPVVIEIPRVVMSWIRVDRDDFPADEPPRPSCHLRIQVWMEEQWSCEVVACFYHQDDDDDDDAKPEENGSATATKRPTFSLVLGRGQVARLINLFRWMEGAWQCHVPDTALTWTREQVAQALAQWTQRQFLPPPDQPSSSSSLPPPSTPVNSARPWTLTFQVPTHLTGSQLETVNLTLSSTSIGNMCHHLTRTGPQLPPTRSNGQSSEQDGSENTQGDDEMGVVEESNTLGLALWRAIRCLILEVFHLDVSALRLVQASCAAASLGCDGRCKPLHPDLLADVLTVLDQVAQERRSSLEPGPEDDDINDEGTA